MAEGETLDHQMKTEYYQVKQGEEIKLPDPENMHCSDLSDTANYIYLYPGQYRKVHMRQKSPLIEGENEKGTIVHETYFTPLDNPYISELEERCGEKLIFPYNS